MIQLIFKNFIQSKGTKIGLVFLLIVGLVSIVIGRQFQYKQAQNTTEATLYQKEHLERNAQYNKDDLGLMLYYVKFSLVNNSLPINSLAIGQRDVNPSIQSVTIRALEGQKYDSELNNPSQLLLGNIDFSFVLIYLFPLLIIAFTFNLVSEEKESGTWKLVATQTDNTFLYILKIFFVRILTFIGLLTLLLFIAAIVLKIPFDTTFYTFYILSFLYLIFWFAVCFYVVSLQKNSNFNALILLTSWLILMIVLPTAINAYIVAKYPIPEALALTLKQRKSYHEKWDTNKEATVEKFYKHYPQFRKYPLPDKEFSWLWYYAMQQMGDDESAVEATKLQRKLEQRNATSQFIAQFIPSLHTQIQLNAIAKSDLNNQLLFWNETQKFHEKLRLYFYPKIFENAPVLDEKWGNFKVERFEDTSKINYINALLPLLVFILGLIVLGVTNYKRNTL